MTRILFITWDAPDAAYLQSLFVPIFAELRADGIAVDVLQFRWGDRSLATPDARACAAAGLGYRTAPIMRRFGGAGALLSALLGRYAVRAAMRHFGSNALMPRSLMPALATLAAGADTLCPVIFDADGLAADERVEFGGMSSLGGTYRVLRDVEAQMVRRAASVMVRSSRAREVLLHRAGPPVGPERFHVVANGRDEANWMPGDPQQRQATRHSLGIADTAPLIAYAGSVGPQYRFDRLGGFAAAVLERRSDTRLLVLTGAPDRARAALAEHGAAVVEAAIIQRAPPDRVATMLACADAGLAFRQAGFSMAAVAPIKLAEYLLCGLPVIGTAAVGDTAAAVQAGVFFAEEAGLGAAADWFTSCVLPERERMRAQARQVGSAHFSLARTVRDYRSAIAPVLARVGNARA